MHSFKFRSGIPLNNAYPFVRGSGPATIFGKIMRRVLLLVGKGQGWFLRGKCPNIPADCSYYYPDPNICIHRYSIGSSLYTVWPIKSYQGESFLNIGKKNWLKINFLKSWVLASVVAEGYLFTRSEKNSPCVLCSGCEAD
jgi:hypothetical protein